MKWLKRILITLLILVSTAVAALFIFLQYQKPTYFGKLQLQNLSNPVEVDFDNYGIPHIYGQNEEDVFRALGYVQAQERLFQMEMLRRVSSGRMSEIFGSSLVDVDRFFRMLGLSKLAEQSSSNFEKNKNEPWAKAALAYLDGVNQYIENGKTPIEFMIMKIPKEKYTVKDMYLVVDYMSFIFQMGFRTDPLITRIRMKQGDEYLRDLGVTRRDTSGRVEEWMSKQSASTNHLAASFDKIEEQLPFKFWMGSNGWVVSSAKSKSGKVLFENDTHIGHQQPAVWYEAHLEYPGFRFYGNFLAGFPFGVLGHTPHHAWGLTILENDDLDFFEEKPNSADTNQVWYKDHWENLELRNETIKIKDKEALQMHCRSSRHGPVCSDVMGDFVEITKNPVAVCWTFLREPNNLFEVTYQLAHAATMEHFRETVSMISAPGLNVIYGDNDNNIAWWAAAKFIKRPGHVNPNYLLDGSTGEDDWIGYYDFTQNPKSENPPQGFVFSANNNPDSSIQNNFPGYYVPGERASRIVQSLSENKQFTVADMQHLNTDVLAPETNKICKKLLALLSNEVKNKSQINKESSGILEQWNGSHLLNDVAPSIYYHWLYLVLNKTFSDEMGEKDFAAFLKTHVEKNTVQLLTSNLDSPWWDDVSTSTKKESAEEIISAAFAQAILDLEMELGKIPTQWVWSRVHTVEFGHPFGKDVPLKLFLNVGPFPEPGGIETVNAQSFTLSPDVHQKVSLGAALRRTLDFADPENGKSVIPTGQSGNFMSRHYDDQSSLYVNGEVRKEMMNREEIQKMSKDKLYFSPTKP